MNPKKGQKREMIIGKVRIFFQTISILSICLGAVIADEEKITSKNSVVEKDTPDGVDIIAEGNDFVIQGEFPEFPETLAAVTKNLSNRLIPPPIVFIPPTRPLTNPLS
jgi:hypothetical protein